MCTIELKPGCQFTITLDHLTYNGLVALRDSLRLAPLDTLPAQDVIRPLLAELDRAIGQD